MWVQLAFSKTFVEAKTPRDLFLIFTGFLYSCSLVSSVQLVGEIYNMHKSSWSGRKNNTPFLNWLSIGKVINTVTVLTSWFFVFHCIKIPAINNLLHQLQPPERFQHLRPFHFFFPSFFLNRVHGNH